MTKNIFIVTFFSILLSTFIYAQTSVKTKSSNKFEIIYQADVKYANDHLWITKIKDDWSATGINLRIYKSLVANNNGKIDWNSNAYQVDNALRKIAESGLDIYLRINLTLLENDTIEKKYNANDFHIRSNGQRFINPYSLKPLLNITSLKARGDMLRFIHDLVSHLNTLPKKVRSKIKLIVPTLTPDDETELPFNSYNFQTKKTDHNLLTGFSEPEILGFMKFLSKRYITIRNLNERWGEGADFNDFSDKQILVRTYKWDGIKSDSTSSDYYKYENGRKDFLDFRREELKKFIDDCSKIVRNDGFKIGVQFGSIYDGLVEFRGFYDPTPLIENVNQMITDDILEYYPNFNFSADYSRSLCKYWNWKKNKIKPIIFSTESNWPGYAGYSPKELIKYWSAQLRIFYEKGARSLFLSHWGTVGSPNLVPEKVMYDSLFPDYRAWQDTLKKFRGAYINTISNDYAFHLAPEQGLNYINETENSGLKSFTHNNGKNVGYIERSSFFEFPLFTFLKIKTAQSSSILYNNNGDIVTSYMINDSPNYTNKKYKYFYKTGSSRFMDRSINLKLD